MGAFCAILSRGTSLPDAVRVTQTTRTSECGIVSNPISAAYSLTSMFIHKSSSPPSSFRSTPRSILPTPIPTIGLPLADRLFRRGGLLS